MPYAPEIKDQLRQKIVWLPAGLADRLAAVVAARKRTTTTYSERRAIIAALTTHLAREESELRIVVAEPDRTRTTGHR